MHNNFKNVVVRHIKFSC